MKGQMQREWGLTLLAPVVGLLPVPIAAAAFFDVEQLGQGLVTLALLVVYGVPELLGAVLPSWPTDISAASPTILGPLAPNASILASILYLLILVSSIVVAVAATYAVRARRSKRDGSARSQHYHVEG